MHFRGVYHIVHDIRSRLDVQVAAVSLLSYMGDASLIILRLRMCLLFRGLKNQVAPTDERGMYAGYRKIPGIFARIPANIRVAAAADNANNLRSSHITKGVYSLYDIATELHEKNTL